MKEKLTLIFLLEHMIQIDKPNSKLKREQASSEKWQKWSVHKTLEKSREKMKAGIKAGSSEASRVKEPENCLEKFCCRNRSQKNSGKVKKILP